MSATPTTDGRRTAAAARRRARKAEIISATRALLDERGVRDAQIEDVARAVGINRAIIYRHFSGKEEIFALTMVGYLDDLHARLDAAGGATPQEQLRGLIEAFVDFGLEYPAFVDCALALMRRPGPELLEEVSESAMFRLGRALTACLDHLVNVLAAGHESGDFHVEDPVLLGNTLYATGLGGLQLARLGIVVREDVPGVPVVTELSADLVKEYLVRAAVALAEHP